MKKYKKILYSVFGGFVPFRFESERYFMDYSSLDFDIQHSMSMEGIASDNLRILYTTIDKVDKIINLHEPIIFTLIPDNGETVNISIMKPEFNIDELRNIEDCTQVQILIYVPAENKKHIVKSKSLKVIISQINKNKISSSGT